MQIWHRNLDGNISFGKVALPKVDSVSPHNKRSLKVALLKVKSHAE